MKSGMSAIANLAVRAEWRMESKALDQIDRVLRSAARLVGTWQAVNCPSFLSSLPTCAMCYIGCMPTSQRMQYCIIALSALVSRSVLHCSYLFDLCCPRSVLGGRRVLRSVARGELLVPRARLAIMQRSAISVVGPSAIQHAVIFHLSCVLY